MKRIPRATYRLQFNREFTFQQAGEIIDYLHELGISDVYASPLFEAGLGSTHGYDVCCFGKINPNLGTGEDFDRFTKLLKARELGLLLDMVPNHMSATPANAWWIDVLENGRESPYASYFDIDWNPVDPALHDKVLLPVLEDPYEKVLEDGKLRLNFHDGRFSISYHDWSFPVNAATLPTGAMDNPEEVVREFNGVAAEASSREKLHALIQRQHYRLAGWKEGAKEINYRRFFDVTGLVALKMELPEVLRATHELIFQWLADGKITGLRIDHPDGLWDPKEYLGRLQKNHPTYVLVEKILSGAEQLPMDWALDGTTGYEFLNRVNGLFVDGSSLPAFDRAYREFTGNQRAFEDIVYRCKKRVLLKSFSGELTALTRRLCGLVDGRGFAFAQCHSVLERIIASFPIYRTYIQGDTSKVSAQDRGAIQKAVKTARGRVESADVGRAESAVFDFVEQLLLLEVKDSVPKAARDFVMKFQQLTAPVMAKGLEDTAFYRFNRLVSLNEVGGDPGKFGVTVEEFHETNLFVVKNWPNTMLATATHDTKRGEDVRARLNVLSEMPDEWWAALLRWSRWNVDKKTAVGGDPAPDANDEYLLYQTVIGAWPHDGDSPGGLKRFRERIVAFMAKAAKEAKSHTGWTEPNAGYENALHTFVENVLSAENTTFLDDLRRMQRRVAFFGRFNSLAQTILKTTSPGVPDFYQGCELWDLSLVDPDNRRPVDYSGRRALFDDLKQEFDSQSDAAGFYAELLRDEKHGAMKMFLIWRTLNFRKAHRELFEFGDYVPLSIAGEKGDHACAFARTRKEKMFVVVAPRMILGLTDGEESPPVGDIWGDTTISMPLAENGVVFENVLTRERFSVRQREGISSVELANALKTFPVALLEKL